MQVKFENITMAYGERNVLQNINFVIPEHSLVSILGPSGCGKSTTLMLISGLTTPSKGKIYFNEREVTKADAVKRKVGMVFQNYALYPHLSVLENIMFPLKMAKISKKERITRAMDLAKLVQIQDHVDKKPKQLSGGQQQRVAIARALAKEPSILLMDEPLSNLDARLRIEMREEIRRIQQETNVTTVFVTHDQEEALSISDQVMVLNDGAIQQISQPQPLYERPVNLFVAKFLGTPIINTFSVDEQQINWTKLSSSLSFKPDFHSIGIRSEKFREAVDEDQAFISGRIRHIERVGKDTSIKIECGQKEVIVTGLSGDYVEGDMLHLTADVQDILHFDKQGNTMVLEAVVG
ncbi:ABC transporter ATP-binding protein [Carnobacterium inhibens]|uniref:ABC transporter ATP-binding protein n=1 Tax=Carnobacterium inhibens subsp. gilichinskyi TaxID=1266845 RepID=U5SBD4_9LACT|nr:ABC transporter ATP-binding protein [Carnobacterium inhibens]AGY81112.1 ABC transporter ATP-binding protein [Carnobacterium inhibens subsp. gilichinskyi]